ncbi:MAG: SprT family zinc-dependent metalloprotease [bacterium]
MPTIILKGEEVSYQIKKHARARRLSLSVQADGSLIATVPPGFAREKIIEKFIKESASWVLRHKKISEKNSNREIKFDRKDYLRNKEQTRALVEEKIKLFNKIYKFKVKSISIRNQKTRWGSCSARGGLNFNYKLIFLPGYAADYIIVHELCHLKELNHSKRFWDLVAKTIPNHLEIRKELKVYNRKFL